MKTLIKNGTLATDKEILKADILIEDEIIIAINKNLKKEADFKIINAKNCFVFPGFIDVHTHFELAQGKTTSCDDFKTGSIAAVCGGTTTIIDFVNPEKEESLKKALNIRLKKAQNIASDFSFHMILNTYNDLIAGEMPEIIKSGVTSFKCFFAYKNMQLKDEEFLKILVKAKEYKALVTLHAENGDLIKILSKKFIKEKKTHPKYHYYAHPDIAEEEAVFRAVNLAKFINQPLYIAHLSCKKALEKIKTARRGGQIVYVETCPQYLLLSKKNYFKADFEGAKYVISPPLRETKDMEVLWNALKDRFIQVAATDHCPFNFKAQKEIGKNDFTKIPNGMAGVGERMSLLYTYGVLKNKISLNQFVEVCAANPSKIFGMYPKKGSIIIGADADLVIFDPQVKDIITASKLKSSVDYTAFEGFEIQGKPRTVLIRGKIAYEEGKYIGKQGKGKFIKRKTFKVD
ncbi:MAG: dihydropyrimidinase [Armatimonadetes bacterium]|nr:dihydropyrimidinase [Armatimonadota bacterium]